MTIPDWINRSTVVAALAASVIGFSAYRVIDKAQPAATDDSSLFKVDVERVVSGHKIKVKRDGTNEDEYVIYAGIYAPDIEEPIGEQARRRNRELVEGKEVRLRPENPPKDHDGRWIGYVFADGKMVNRILVAEGLVHVRLMPGTRRYAGELLSAQSEARIARRGLWKQKDTSLRGPVPADKKYAVFHRPDCEDVPKTKPENKTSFSTQSDAFDAGFAPCKKCKP